MKLFAVLFCMLGATLAHHDWMKIAEDCGASINRPDYYDVLKNDVETKEADQSLACFHWCFQEKAGFWDAETKKPTIPSKFKKNSARLAKFKECQDKDDATKTDCQRSLAIWQCAIEKGIVKMRQ